MQGQQREGWSAASNDAERTDRADTDFVLRRQRDHLHYRNLRKVDCACDGQNHHKRGDAKRRQEEEQNFVICNNAVR